MIEVWHNEIGNDEIQCFEQCIRNHQIMEGDTLKEFEDRLKVLLNIPYVIGTSSGTDALTLALMAIGIRPGDEVIVPDLTFIATANAAYLLGAKVVLAPTEKERPLLDLDQLDSCITAKTRAIIVVDLNGRIVSSKQLKERYAHRGIYIVEDACQAFMSGTGGKLAGTEADIGCFSFGITKTVSTIKGGMVATENKELYDKMRIMKTQGLESVFECDLYRYPGANFKLPDGLAAIGLVQLERLEQKISHMKMIHDMYVDELKNIDGISFIRGEDCEFLWMQDILCENRNYVRNVLEENGVKVRPQGMPLHNAAFLEKRGNYTFSTELQEKMLYLPSGPDQPVENVEEVIRILSTKL